MSGDGGDDDAGADDLQTVMWTRALAGLDRHNVEGCEDLLDTYFTQVSKHTSRIGWVLTALEAGLASALAARMSSYCLTSTLLQASMATLD